MDPNDQNDNGQQMPHDDSQVGDSMPPASNPGQAPADAPGAPAPDSGADMPGSGDSELPPPPPAGEPNAVPNEPPAQ